MSWGIQVAGKPKAVVDTVNKDSYVPNSIKAAIAAAADEMVAAEMMVVTGAGHYNPNSSPGYPATGNATLDIKFIREAKEDIPPPGA